MTEIQVIISILSIGGIWEVIKYMLQRKYSKEDKHDELMNGVLVIKEEVNSLKRDLSTKISILSDKVDKNAAVLARTHILRFDDELINGVHHSREYFRQQLQDIDTYIAYCDTHPGFKNSYADAAIHHIRHTYEELLNTREFKDI
jgi:hypothetical protein